MSERELVVLADSDAAATDGAERLVTALAATAPRFASAPGEVRPPRSSSRRSQGAACHSRMPSAP